MLCLHARGKINWTLDILGKREDGYHLMDMLLQSVSLCDTLWLEEAEALSLTDASPEGAGGRDGAPPPREAVPFDDSNLVCRAAAALRAYAGVSAGARMGLIKRIPSGAGMGGGSADAAAALIGLNRLWGLGLPFQTLLEIGLGVGADVPFQLTGGLARVGGIGEAIAPLTPAPQIWLALTQPCGGLSTGEIFAAFDGHTADAASLRPDTRAAQDALLEGDLPALARAMGNVMEGVSAARRPQIGQAKAELERLGALRAMMTGSGSVVYGVFQGRAEAEEAARTLSARGWYASASCTQEMGITFAENVDDIGYALG